MKSDIIKIDNQCSGFSEAVAETKRFAGFMELSDKESVQLQLCAEEMLSLARSVTGEMEASFWLENEGKRIDLNMTTKTVMDKEKRYNLISSSTSQKNEAANSFLGKLRDAFEEAMASDVEHVYYELPAELVSDVSHWSPVTDEWDGYEQSVLRRLADDIKIYIRGGLVRMTVSKTF